MISEISIDVFYVLYLLTPRVSAYSSDLGKMRLDWSNIYSIKNEIQPASYF